MPAKYKMQVDWTHPRRNSQGQVYQHILVAEKALGHYLPEGAEIHHVNGDGWDNSPGNLVICENRSYHQELHRRQEAKLACGHADWWKCHFCKEYGPKEEFSDHKSHGKYHTKCKTAYCYARMEQNC